MDTTKQPDIIIENILLIESEFKRVTQVPFDIKMHIDITVGVGLSDDKERLVVEMIGLLNQPDAPVYARVKYAGIFVYGPGRNMTLEEYAQACAPATILPYVRQELHQLTQRAGVHQVLIPPVNTTAVTPTTIVGKKSVRAKKTQTDI